MSNISKPTAPHSAPSHDDVLASPASKRPRGRPKGSGKFVQSDYKVLVALAERCARDPAIVPTKVFRDLGYTGRSELSRLNEAWRQHKDALLPETQQRLAAQRRFDALGELVAGLSFAVARFKALMTSPVGQAFTGVIANKAQSVLESVQAGYARHALREGNSAELALDPSRAQGSIERFEGRKYRTLDDLASVVDPQHSMDDMPDWQTYYAAALCYYELSLDAWEKERKAVGGEAAVAEHSDAQSSLHTGGVLDSLPGDEREGDV